MKVLANDGISESGKKALIDAGIEVMSVRVSSQHLAKFINENNIDVLLVRSATKVTKELMESCSNLKIIGRGGIGLDNIDVKYAKEKGLQVINTPDSPVRSVAELVFAHFFSLARNLHKSNRQMPLEGDTKFSELKKSFSNAYELKNKTLGIIGMGKIGLEVAKIGISLEMTVLPYNRTPKIENVSLNFYDGQKVEFQLKSCNFDEVLEKSDFISINTSKTDSYIIDEQEFLKMKDGVFIANTSRGGVINETCLLDFLKSGKIAGVALDVFENEPYPEVDILMNPDTSLSPHIGGSTIDAQEKIWLELAQKLIKTKLTIK